MILIDSLANVDVRAIPANLGFYNGTINSESIAKLIICLSCKHRPDCIVVGHSTEFCPKDCNESAQMERFLESFGVGTVTIDHSLMHCASSVCDITLWQLMWGVMLMHD